ncbi:MAG: HD domain-containing phosphohydrolase [Gemmatimonadales bacterium]
MAPEANLRFSEIVSALSYALDLTEGQVLGHSARTALIGMRLAETLGLSAEDRSALFYALLLKDAGCSSNAARLCAVFQADDRSLKQDHKRINWRKLGEAARYTMRHVAPAGSRVGKLARFFRIATTPDEVGRELIAIRCERGADIALMLGLPHGTAEAIRSLDEHWDGGGHAAGLAGQQIPLLGRILCLSQTMEVFVREQGLASAYEVIERRAGSWFDPELVEGLVGFRNDRAFWTEALTDDVRAALEPHEPEDRVLHADEARLDRVAEAFARVIDAKSPFTFRHSERVALVAVRIGEVLGFDAAARTELRRAALLHDIGKLGVSNMILDKNGPLDDTEWDAMRAHTRFTLAILNRVAPFRGFAEMAASHHERLDGKGYHRGVGAEFLGTAARALAVADVCEALSASRPYREALPWDEVMRIIGKGRGSALDAECCDALAGLGATVLDGGAS